MKIKHIVISFLVILAMSFSACSHEIALTKADDDALKAVAARKFTQIPPGVNINATRKKDGRTLLILAVISLDADTVKLLLDAGADPSKGDAKGFTPLHYASSANVVEIMELLVKSGADIEGKTSNGITPVMEAARLGNVASVKFLADKGASLIKADKRGRTVLMSAGRAPRNSLELVKYIIEAGANPNDTDSDGKNVMLHAIDSGNTECALFFINSMNDFDIPSKDSALAFTASKHAIASGNGTVLKRIIEKKLPLNSDASTVLKGLEIANVEGVFQFFARNGIVDDGKTPLFWAAFYDKNDIINMLIEAGADPNVRDHAGSRAVDYANSYETVKLLRDAMKKAAQEKEKEKSSTSSSANTKR